MRALFKAENFLVKAEKAVVVLLISALVALSFMQVLLRLLFHSGVVWLDPLLRHMVLWAGLTGAALAARYSNHFALEAFVKFAPKKLHRPLEILSACFTIAASLLLFGAAFKFIREEFTCVPPAVAFYINHFKVLGGWAEIIIPAAFALIAFHAFAGLFRPDDPPEAGL